MFFQGLRTPTTITATTMRRMMIAIHIHFLEFFCKLFALWRAVFPDWTWSTAFDTYNCQHNTHHSLLLKWVTSMRQECTHLRSTYSFVMLLHTWDSMLSSISPCASTKTAMSIKICIKKKKELDEYAFTQMTIQWSITYRKAISLIDCIKDSSKYNILVVSQEVSFPSLWQHHDVLEFPPMCPLPGREQINKLLCMFNQILDCLYTLENIYQTCPLPCSWIAFWKICSLFPVSISSSIVWKNPRNGKGVSFHSNFWDH